ncbi:hypothetical protein [Krasilnikovia sp. MM14-A1259]|uniref:hypothetical protein n=1 Tax=Krasilnikovia sp. MM14-A1259 TaxID=3373539 RepID=UPI0038143F3D
MNSERAHTEAERIRHDIGQQIRRARRCFSRLAETAQHVADVERQVAGTHDELAAKHGDGGYRRTAEEATAQAQVAQRAAIRARSMARGAAADESATTAAPPRCPHPRNRPDQP